MDCVECKSSNLDDSRYCSRCGAELGRTLEETARKRFRDRKAIEIEITETVAARLVKWSGYVRNTVAIIVALFALLIGWSYHDLWKAVGLAKAEISDSARAGENEIDRVRKEVAGLRAQAQVLQSELDRYSRVDRRIEELQNNLTKVKGEVLDLSNRELRVKELRTTGPGGGMLRFFGTGCDALGNDAKIGYCVQGSPPALFQITHDGQSRPVSGLSPTGFQDTSSSARPSCNASRRGTFYVEKGTANAADRPYLCAKESDNTYKWMQVELH